jgi:bacterioferritin-associated ferredoxin
MSCQHGAVAIVGSGPAGSGVSEVLSAVGIRHDIYDEAARSGGNVGRQSFDAPPASIESDPSLRRMYLNAAVLSVTPECCIEFDKGRGPEQAPYDAVFICAGAYDLQLPSQGRFPNWSSAGALQALLKGQGIMPNGKVLLAGAGPFVFIAGSELARAGVGVVAVVDAVPLHHYASLLPLTLVQPLTLVELLRAFGTLRQTGASLYFGAQILAVDEQTARLSNGHTIAFDHLGTSDCFAPQTQLARTAGCRQSYSRRGNYFFTDTDLAGRTNQRGIFVCGEGQGVRGSTFARLSGLISALSWLKENGRSGPPGYVQAELESQAKRVIHFAEKLEDTMYRPVRVIADDAWVCACERVEARRVREAIATGLADLSSIKIVTRCGMGSCQGRYCEPLICRLFAEAGKEPLAPFSQRGLARPILAGDLANA